MGCFPIAYSFRYGPYRGRDDRQFGEHRLKYGLRHSFIGIGGEAEYVQRLKPLFRVVLLTRKNHVALQSELADFIFQMLFLRAIAYDQQFPAGGCKLMEGFQQVAVSLPTAQGGDDTEVVFFRIEPQVASRSGFVTGHETGRVDTGGHRGYAFWGQPEITDEGLPERLASRHNVFYRFAI